MVVEVTADDMLAIGLHCIGFGQERIISHCQNTKMKHFESAFGIDPNTSCIVFHDLQVYDIGEHRINKPKVPYFFLTLFWLKRYPIEQISSGLFGYHEATVRKWVWKFCRAIQALMQYKVSKHICIVLFL
jgi:hypothetical protein